MKLKVLIADPNELLLAVYRVFLAMEGAEVITVNNSRDCLAALRQSLPDILIIEPALLGEFRTEIKTLVNEGETLPTVPVLLLTSHPEDVAEWTAPLTVCRFLIKPVSPATVAGVVRTFVESREALHV